MTQEPGDMIISPRPLAILASPSFVIAVALLIMNDWILKASIGSWWTGKLSDFAGLFAFALFWSALFPRRQPTVLAVIAVAFVIWKSPLSEPVLERWNAIGLWPLSRVEDYTDNIALTALLPAYWVSQRPVSTLAARWARFTRQLMTIGAAGTAVLAFAATSRVAPTYRFPPHEGYHVAAPRSSMASALDSLNLDRWLSLAHASVVDTVQGCIDKRYGKWICVRIELRDAPDCGTALMLIDTQTIINKPDLLTVRQEFERKVVEPLQARFGRC